MPRKEFIAPNISCGHCTHTIETEVGEIEGVKSVKADKDSKKVEVTWDEPATWEKIRNVLEEIGFPPAE